MTRIEINLISNYQNKNTYHEYHEYLATFPNLRDFFGECVIWSTGYKHNHFTNRPRFF